MSEPEGCLERAWAFYALVVDPAVDTVLAQTDPWDAYHRTHEMMGLLADTFPGGAWDLPHAGVVYAAWATLTDVYDTGSTPIGVAHATLRAAATAWLRRPAGPTADFIEDWVSEANERADAMFKRDGDWWHEPP